MKIIRASVLIALIGLPGLAIAQIPKPLPPTVIIDSAVNTVTVQNDRTVPVTVYLQTGVFDRRLGIAAPLATTTLPLPSWAANGRMVRLFAHPEDEPQDLASENFRVSPPGRIGMEVPTRAAMHRVASTDTMTEFIPPEEVADATLTVDNQRDVPVTVFASAGLVDARLGEVPAKSRATLRFPKSVITPLSTVGIILHPQGGRDLGSDYMRVRAGDHLGLKVPQW